MKLLLKFILLFTLISSSTFATVSYEGKELKEIIHSARKFTEKFGIKTKDFITEIGKHGQTGAIGDLSKIGNLVKNASDDVVKWIGKDAKFIKKKTGDIVILSKNGKKRFRIDINRTNPHNNPHGHVEEFIDDAWKKSGPIYPNDVPHN